MYIWLILLLHCFDQNTFYYSTCPICYVLYNVHDLLYSRMYMNWPFLLLVFILLLLANFYICMSQSWAKYMFFIEIKNHIMKINLLGRICNVIHSPFLFLWTYHEPFKILYTICFVQFIHMEKKEYDIIYDVVDVVMITWRHCR